MSIYEPEDRFRALGMKVPDLTFLRKPVPPSKIWGAESLYGTRTLVGNWYEDRRMYKQICPRYTGMTITKSDYDAKCPSRDNTFPPVKYARDLRNAGEGITLLRNTEDYCDYLENFTTTYDLMHNWEVRRAGVKPKPWRKWKLVQDASWFPDRDNTLSFGNLTQIGYRKAPQLPLLPNDWDVYANNPTTYETSFGEPRYPADYVHCRKAASKEIRKENEEMMTIRVPGSENDPCYQCIKKHNKKRPDDLSCPCICHAIDDALKNPSKKTRAKGPAYNTPRFSDFMPAGRLKQTPGIQTLHAGDTPFPYRTLKHPPHIRNTFTGEMCKPDCPAWESSIGRKSFAQTFEKPDVCNDYAGDVRRD